MSKFSKFVVETRISDLNRYVSKREEYERFFNQCNGQAFIVEYMREGIEEGNTAIFIACFLNEEDSTEYNRLINQSEKSWSSDADTDTVLDNMLDNMTGE